LTARATVVEEEDIDLTVALFPWLISLHEKLDEGVIYVSDNYSGTNVGKVLGGKVTSGCDSPVYQQLTIASRQIEGRKEQGTCKSKRESSSECVYR